MIAVMASMLLFAGMCMIPTHHHIDVGGYDSAYVQGFFDQQTIPPEFAQSGNARWSSDAAAVIIPQLGIPTQFSIKIIAPTPKQLTLRAITRQSFVIRRSPIIGKPSLAQFRTDIPNRFRYL
jgi:hypothetical protein